MAAIEEEAGEVCADEAGGAGDEDAVMHGCEVATALTLAGVWYNSRCLVQPRHLFLTFTASLFQRFTKPPVKVVTVPTTSLLLCLEAWAWASWFPVCWKVGQEI